jgi:hypothetical protein
METGGGSGKLRKHPMLDGAEADGFCAPVAALRNLGSADGPEARADRG